MYFGAPLLLLLLPAWKIYQVEPGELISVGVVATADAAFRGAAAALRQPTPPRQIPT
jgi:hypothetical protein